MDICCYAKTAIELTSAKPALRLFAVVSYFGELTMSRVSRSSYLKPSDLRFEDPSLYNDVELLVPMAANQESVCTAHSHVNARRVLASSPIPRPFCSQISFIWIFEWKLKRQCGVGFYGFGRMKGGFDNKIMQMGSPNKETLEHRPVQQFSIRSSNSIVM